MHFDSVCGGEGRGRGWAGVKRRTPDTHYYEWHTSQHEEQSDEGPQRLRLILAGIGGQTDGAPGTWEGRVQNEPPKVKRKEWNTIRAESSYLNRHLAPVVRVKTALLLFWTHVGAAMCNRKDLHVPANLQVVHQVERHAMFKWLEGVAVDVNLDRLNWSTIIFFYIVRQTFFFLVKKTIVKYFNSLKFRGKSKKQVSII